MSGTTSTDTAAATTPPDNPQTGASTGWFNVVLSAVSMGAATIYHKVVALEADVTQWEADHPELAPLIDNGVAYAATFMTRLGVPVGAVILVGEDIMAALKALAAADPTIQSGAATAVPAPAKVAP